MAKLMPALAAEAVGTFGLCFVGIMAIHIARSPDFARGVDCGGAGAWVDFGDHDFDICGDVGGAFESGGDGGAVGGGKIKAGPAAGYVVAQVLGGVLAGWAVMGILPEGAAVVANGTPAIALEKGQMVVTAAGGCLAELITTFFLVLAVWGTAVDGRSPKIGGFGIGLTVTADILAIGPLTGAAMNPARALGPAIAAALAGQKYDWGDHWIYWVGPVVGGILASVLYTRVMGEK